MITDLSYICDHQGLNSAGGYSFPEVVLDLVYLSIFLLLAVLMSADIT